MAAPNIVEQKTCLCSMQAIQAVLSFTNETSSLQTARETSLAKKTGEIFTGVGRQAQTSYSKAMENEKAGSLRLIL